MARVQVIVTRCDLCGAEDDTVKNHRVAVDSKAAVKLDACASCWAEPEAVFARLREVGTRERRSRKS